MANFFDDDNAPLGATFTAAPPQQQPPNQTVDQFLNTLPPFPGQDVAHQILTGPTPGQPGQPTDLTTGLNPARQQIIDFWMSKGAPRQVAEGIADRVNIESGFNPAAVGKAGEIGLYQNLGPRAEALQKLPGWQTLPVQNQFAYNEVTGGDPMAAAHWDEIKNAKTREEAQQLWTKYFERPQNYAPIGSGTFFDVQINPQGILDAQKDKNTSVGWIDVNQLIDSLTKDTNTEAQDQQKRTSLTKSVLDQGEPIHDIPTLDVAQKNGQLTVTDFDGLHRAQLLRDAGYDYIPVAIKGVNPSNVSAANTITGMTGQQLPFHYTPVNVPKEFQPPQTPSVAAMIRALPGQLGRAAEETLELPLGAIEGAGAMPYGAAQLAARGAEAVGIPGSEALANYIDQLNAAREQVISGLSPDAQRMAAIGDIGTAALLPMGRIAEMSRLLRPLGTAVTGATAGALQPVGAGPQPTTLQDFIGQKAGQELLGGALGGGTQAIAEVPGLLGAGARALSRKPISREDLTKAAIRILGEKAVDKITPEQVNKLIRNAGDRMEKIENSHDVVVDDELLGKLTSVDADAREAYGDSPEKNRIVKALDNIFARADEMGVIPAKSAATLWHRGSELDNLTESSNSKVKQMALDAQSAVRNALNRQLPPDVAQEYSQARSDYRDAKIIQKAIPLGMAEEQTLEPRAFASAVKKKFPDYARTPEAARPPMLRLGAATGTVLDDLTKVGLLPRIIGSFLGGKFVPGIGHAAGWHVGSTIAQRLNQLHMNQAAANVIRGPQPMNALLRWLDPRVGGVVPPVATGLAAQQTQLPSFNYVGPQQ